MNDLPDWLYNIGLPLVRWIHIVGAMLLVGGILFFEFVVPASTEDLLEEQRMAVFGRARWVFSRVIWVSILALLVSGLISTFRIWPSYNRYDQAAGSKWLACKPWFLGHVGLGLLGLAMSIRVTQGSRLLRRPVRWMQITFMLLLVSIFLACVTRHMGLRIHEWRDWSQHLPSMNRP